MTNYKLMVTGKLKCVCLEIDGQTDRQTQVYPAGIIHKFTPDVNYSLDRKGLYCVIMHLW